jgi:hypothetical protein
MQETGVGWPQLKPFWQRRDLTRLQHELPTRMVREELLALTLFLSLLRALLGLVF